MLDYVGKVMVRIGEVKIGYERLNFATLFQFGSVGEFEIAIACYFTQF
jgi:hypothetical protein